MLQVFQEKINYRSIRERIRQNHREWYRHLAVTVAHWMFQQGQISAD